MLRLTVNAPMVALPPRVSPPRTIASFSSISFCIQLGLCAPATVFRGSVGRPGSADENGTGSQRERERGREREINRRSARKEPMSEGGGAGGSVSGRVP